MVQLPNIAEFYVVFFALIRLGVAPVNALFSHNENELSAYAKQIQPRILIASSRHALFHDALFFKTLFQASDALQHALIVGKSEWAESLDSVLERSTDMPLHAEPSRADEVAFFQLSGGSTGTPKLIPRTHNDYFLAYAEVLKSVIFLPQQSICALCLAPTISP